jgi:hypothetical protein
VFVAIQSDNTMNSTRTGPRSRYTMEMATSATAIKTLTVHIRCAASST